MANQKPEVDLDTEVETKVSTATKVGLGIAITAGIMTVIAFVISLSNI